MARAETLRLDFLHAFGSGCGHKLRDTVCLGDDDSRTVIYLVGRHIAVKSLINDDTNFIKEPDKVTRITAMTITPEKSKRFLAVAEFIEMENSPLVSVFDLKTGAYFKRIRQLGFSDMNAEAFVCICFSSDSRLIAVMSGPPDYVAIVWDWYKDKLIAKYAIGSKVTRISINPKDHNLLCTTGPSHWRSWRIDEKTFKSQPSFSGMDRSQTYTDHAWMNEEVVIAASENGEVFVVRNGEVVQVIEFPFGKTLEAVQRLGHSEVTTLICGSKGFFVGSSEGIVAYWEKVMQDDPASFDQFNFQFARTWDLGEKRTVISLSLSHNELSLAYALESNSVGTCRLTQNIAEMREVYSQTFCKGYHSGPIQSMDLAIQRPLILTCSTRDSSIRVWNYLTFSCEVYKNLHDAKDIAGLADSIHRQVLCAAFHPSGYYIAISFEDKIRMFHLLYDDLRFYREINIKNANCLRFSNGGHFLAAAASKVVYIFTSYTLEHVEQFKSHTNTVNDMAWSRNDLRITTVGGDGAVFEYDIQSSSKEREFISRNTDYTSVAYIDDAIVTCGVDAGQSVLREQVDTDWKTHNVAVKSKLTQIHYFKTYHGLSCLLAGDSNGSIHMLGFKAGSAVLGEIVAHNGGVTRIRSSQDGRFVFSCGNDGVIFIYHVIEPREMLQPMDRMELDQKEKDDAYNKLVDDRLAEIVLIPRNLLDQFKINVEGFNQEINNMKQKIEYHKGQQEMQYNEQLKEMRETMWNELQTLVNKYDEITRDKAKQEREYLEKFENLGKAHHNAVDNVEELYEKKLSIEDEKFRRLEKERTGIKNMYEDQIRTLQKQNEEAIENLAKEFRDTLKQTQDQYESTRKTAEELKLVYEERLAQQEDEHENEILEVREKYEAEVEAQSAENTKFRRENENLVSEQKMFIEEHETIHVKLEKKRQTLIKLDETIGEYKGLIQHLEQERDEKEKNLLEKESKIRDYKSQIKDLDKTKHVLDARKKEILDEIQPKDQEIVLLKKKLKRIHNDCDKERKLNQDLKKKMDEKGEMQKKLQEERKAKKGQTKEREKKLRDILNDIHAVVNNQDSKIWVDEIKKLYKKYVSTELGKVSKKDPECIDEMEEQMRYMQKSIGLMKDTQSRSEMKAKEDMHKRTMENSSLITELYQLRNAKKNNENRIKQLQLQMKNIQHAINTTEREIKQRKPSESQRSVTTLPDINPLPVPRSISAKPKSTPPASKLYKGSVLDSKISQLQEKQRITQLNSEVQSRREENYYLKMELNRLRDEISKSASALYVDSSVQDMVGNFGSYIQRDLTSVEIEPEMRSTSREE